MERFLIGILGRNVNLGSSNDGSDHNIKIPCQFDPIVTSITFSIYFPYWNAHVDPSPNHIIIFGASKYYQLDDTTTTHIETIKPTSKDIEFNSLRHGSFTITSFTTTDGKVHTANNLNY